MVREVGSRIAGAGGRLDLAARSLVAPPQELLVALQTLPRTDGYAELPSSVRNGR